MVRYVTYYVDQYVRGYVIRYIGSLCYFVPVEIVDNNSGKKMAPNLISGSQEDACTLAGDEYWIPFSTTSQLSEFNVPVLQLNTDRIPIIEFNAIPSISSLKLAFINVLLLNTADIGLNIINNMWHEKPLHQRKQSLVRACELISQYKHALTSNPDHTGGLVCILNVRYHEALSRLSVLEHLLLHQIATMKTASFELPKWKGKSMQFIELISIGIELNLFEGSNQNQICNSLLKAFQVDAESDQPIYKQRFDALFRRSKVHLPLVGEFIRKVEESKQIKLIIHR